MTQPATTAAPATNATPADPALSWQIPGTHIKVPVPFGGVVTDTTHAVANLTAIASDLFAVIVKAGQWVGNVDNWIRVAKVVVGGALVIAGVEIAARPYVEPVVRGAVKAGTTVVKTGAKVGAVAAA